MHGPPDPGQADHTARPSIRPALRSDDSASPSDHAAHRTDRSPRRSGRPSFRPDHPALDRAQVAASRAVQRRTGPTFHLATRLFPRDVRHATYALYGFVRAADEVVDGPGAHDPVRQRRVLARLRRIALGRQATADPVLAAFQVVRETSGLRDEDVEAFLDAMVADVDGARYRTPEDLDAYVRGSAAAVSHMMTAVMGVEDPAARPHAAALGAAFQLTNFLRDVREDVVELDRVYLPDRTLRRYGASHADVERLAFGPGVAAAVRDELLRAETLYREGVAGVHFLPQRCQFPVLAAAVLYAEYHRAIRDRGYDVLSGRPSLGPIRKLVALARVGYHWLRTRDPEAAFYAASAVPRVPDEPRPDRDGAGVDRWRPSHRVDGPLHGATGGNRGD